MSPYGSYEGVVDLLGRQLSAGPFLLGERLTAANKGLTLAIAANYGGRWDILQALGVSDDTILELNTLGDKESRSKDILGRVYEYFLGQFANAEGKKGGQFYTPASVVKVIVEIFEPQLSFLRIN